MTFIDTLQNFFLFFGHQPAYALVIILGSIFYKDKTFWHAFVLLFFTMIFSATLKNIFQIPLNPALGIEGYAFPSGHMQAAVAFYGWIFYTIKNRTVRILIPCILLGQGWAMIHAGFHSLTDELAGFTVSVMLILAYGYFKNRELLKKYPFAMGWILVGVAIPMLVFLRTDVMPTHVWGSFYGLIGFLLGWTLYGKKELLDDLNIRWKVIFSLLTIGFFVLVSTFVHEGFKSLSDELCQSYKLILGAFLPIGTWGFTRFLGKTY
ncbi:MAG: phosphatase PAP2 family protein [Alphaproteobacteria bacterium]